MRKGESIPRAREKVPRSPPLVPVAENESHGDWGFSPGRSSYGGSSTYSYNDALAEADQAVGLGRCLSPVSLSPLRERLEATLEPEDAESLLEIARMKMEVALRREVDRAKRIEIASLRAEEKRKVAVAKEEAVRSLDTAYKKAFAEELAAREAVEAHLARMQTVADQVEAAK